MNMKFSERLKHFRESKGLTQAQLAELSGISTRMIQKYEGGVSRPRYDATEKLAAALEVPVGELMGSADLFVTQAAAQYGSRGAKQAQQLKIGRTFMLHGVISCQLLEALLAFSARRILMRCWNLVFPCLMSAR